MTILKTTIASLVLLSTMATAVSFEQNGVKEGNDRLSVTLLSTVPDEGDERITIQAQYGRFITDNIEILLEGSTYIFGTDTSLTTVGLGANYYFAKTPVLTPYAGFQGYVYHVDSNNVTDDITGGDIHVGVHYFLNENAAITPVAGSQFIDFTDYTQSYLNIYLTYFFN